MSYAARAVAQPPGFAIVTACGALADEHVMADDVRHVKALHRCSLELRGGTYYCSTHNSPVTPRQAAKMARDD